MPPSISAVIPTYRRHAQLKSAVQSAISQSFEGDLDIIVVDDNPPDSEIFAQNWAMLARDFPQVRHIANDQPRGGGGARNCGILSARGEWIAFLDDDDTWLPGKLSRQWQLAARVAENVACIDTGFFELDEASGTQTAVLPKLQGEIFADLLVKHNGRAPKLSTLICRRDALIAVGMFDKDLPSRQDIDLYLRLARQFHFASVPEPLAVKHLHAGERISTNPGKKIAGFEMFLKKYAEDFRARPDLYRIFQRQFAKRLYRAGRYASAARVLMKSLIRFP